MLTEVTWEGTFDAAHFIPGHPKCGRLHGHTYHVKAVLIYDFEPTSRDPYPIDYGKIKEIVHELDHRLIIPKRLIVGATHDGPSGDVASIGVVEIRWQDFSHEQMLRVSKDWIAKINYEASSAECLAEHILGRIDSIRKVVEGDLTVKETPNTGATSWIRRQ